MIVSWKFSIIVEPNEIRRIPTYMHKVICCVCRALICYHINIFSKYMSEIDHLSIFHLSYKFTLLAFKYLYRAVDKVDIVSLPHAVFNMSWIVIMVFFQP